MVQERKKRQAKKERMEASVTKLLGNMCCIRQHKDTGVEARWRKQGRGGTWRVNGLWVHC